ncbi:MAG: FtsX-like permease family protein [Firmicutes bacterium]|nr:FtsX-like permease family protein [Bacillota bacterium]
MLEIFEFTFRIMKKRPLRSLLTILQLALGVWIVALILSLNLQGREKFVSQQEAFGESLVKISISQSLEQGDELIISTVSNLHGDDLERLGESENIEAAFIYEPHWRRDLLVGDLAYRVGMAASASWEYGQAMGLEMAEGHFFTQADQKHRNNVAVVSEVISGQLFPDRSPLGQKINLGSFGGETLEYEIVGVYKPLSPVLQLFLPESYIIFPLHYGAPGFLPESERFYHEIVLKAVPGRVFAAVEDARMILADRILGGREIRGEYFRDYDYFSRQIQTMTIFLGAFAFVAIIISSLGILSIMLVSVVERTKEIGLRRALGASKLTIIFQILNESLVLSLLGVLLGLGAAAVTAKPLLTILVQEMVFPRIEGLGGLHPLAAFLAFLLAVTVSQLFGLYPALQGGKISPREALRQN